MSTSKTKKVFASTTAVLAFAGVSAFTDAFDFLGFNSPESETKSPSSRDHGNGDDPEVSGPINGSCVAVGGATCTNDHNTAVNGSCVAVDDATCTNNRTFVDNKAMPPLVNVVGGPDHMGQPTWALQIRNFQPSTTVRVRLRGPSGENLGLLRTTAKRTVKADGTSDTKKDHFFWTHENGEPTGRYEVIVRGTAYNDAGGEPRTVRDTFVVR